MFVNGIKLAQDMIQWRRV